MPIALTDDHRALAATAADFLEKHDARGASRSLLSAKEEGLPAFWKDLAALGWLGLHLPERHGGSGYGLPELVVVLEELGRALAPGPFVPTVIASAVLAACAEAELADRLLPGLADGTILGAVALDSDATVDSGALNGNAPAGLGAGMADVLLIACGDDVAVVERGALGLDVTVPPNLDPTRRSARLRFEQTPAQLLSGARSELLGLARTILSAEAVGIAAACTEQAAAYAKVRVQFGRPIGTFQAVKHHCANMAVASELSTAAVWDAARGAGARGDQLAYTAAVAALVAIPAAEQNAQLNIQVHGGIGFTWEHDAHLFLRRATALQALVDLEVAGQELCGLVGAGVERPRTVDLPAEAEAFRTEVRRFIAEAKGSDEAARRQSLIDSGYAVPHWPKPYGRDAGAVEQLVIEQEFADAGITRPSYGITGWVILTLLQQANEDQVARWVLPALRREVIWCQLFSEPDAGSDAAGVTSRGVKVDAGWVVNGQKVWTSGAHQSRYGLATVRTDPAAKKHAGITTMVIDLEADGVEVRPLKMTTGRSEFNEVFFNDVFVPDDDVVGPINGGWTVARATLGNESVSIGGGEGGSAVPGPVLLDLFSAHPERLGGGLGRVGRYVAQLQAMQLMNLRSAQRAVAGSAPGPEGAITKLVLSELGHEAAAVIAALTGNEALYLDGPGALSSMIVLMHRAMSIAGGTSEIKRNQIAERILGLPRDPLLN